MENKMKALVHEDESFNNIVYPGKETKDREFEKCSFTNCDFSNGIFASSKFINCVFTNCNLAMTKLRQCRLNHVVFKECKLLGVNFSECNDFLFSVRFDGCVLDYSSFLRKKMPNISFMNSSMKNVDFTECDLTRSVFSNTDLTNSVFNRTVLKEVNFLTASNYSIDPELNNIKKAKFSLYGLSGLLDKYDIEIE